MKADDTLQGALPSIVLVRKTSFIGLFAQASQYGPLKLQMRLVYLLKLENHSWQDVNY